MQAILCERKDCIGCFACLQSCKQKAISIENSDDGFLYPVINHAKCVNCGVCSRSCPIISLNPPYKYNHESPCYSAYHKEVGVRMKSSSGGLFYTLATNVIEKGGCVYGAGWMDDMVLRHQKAEDKDSLMKLMRSKYVQSDTSEVYQDVREELKSGREILFSGTPCQVAALKSFLGNKEYPQLLTVDVICQGVPSPVIFRKYLDAQEEKYGSKVVDVVFRTKEKGWRCGLLLLLLLLADGREIELKYKKNDYYHAFLKNYFLRESCYSCQFKQCNKGCFSDITLADFWRIGTVVPFKCESYDKGVSAVLTNTEKGKKSFDEIKEFLVWEHRTFGEFSTNGGLSIASCPPRQKEATKAAMNRGMDEVQSEYFPYTWRAYLSDLLNMHLSYKTIQNIKKWTRK